MARDYARTENKIMPRGRGAFLPMPLNKLDTKPSLGTVQADKVENTLTMPRTGSQSKAAPMTGLPMDIGVNGASKIMTKDGKTIYSDAPAIGMMQRPQASGMKSVGGTTPQERYAMQQAEFAGQDMQSQLAREEAAAAENKRQNLAMFATPQIGMSEELQNQLSRTLQTYNSGMTADSAAGNARAKIAGKQIEDLLQTQGQVTDQQLKAFGMGQEGNQYSAKLAEDKRQANQRYDLGMADINQKNPYYESMIAENNAQALAATMPRLGQGNDGWEIKEITAPDGSTQLVRANKLTGVAEPFKQAPMTPEQKAQQTALGNYKLAMDKLNVLDKDSPLYAQRLNALDNDPEVKQLRALGLI